MKSPPQCPVMDHTFETSLIATEGNSANFASAVFARYEEARPNGRSVRSVPAQARTASCWSNAKICETCVVPLNSQTNVNRRAVTIHSWLVHSMSAIGREQTIHVVDTPKANRVQGLSPCPPEALVASRQIPRTPGCAALSPSISAVSAQTSASARSGDAPGPA